MANYWVQYWIKTRQISDISKIVLQNKCDNVSGVSNYICYRYRCRGNNIKAIHS
jgi:hypothetical protein